MYAIVNNCYLNMSIINKTNVNGQNNRSKKIMNIEVGAWLQAEKCDANWTVRALYQIKYLYIRTLSLRITFLIPMWFALIGYLDNAYFVYLRV